MRYSTVALGFFMLLWSGCQNNPKRDETVALCGPERLELHSRALDQLLLAAGSDLDIVSCNAIEALVEVAPRDGLPAFRKATRSESPVVRYAGFVALGERRDHKSLDLMVTGVKNVHPHVRLAAAFAAYRCGKEGAARLLVRALTDSPEDGLRAEAAALIGRLEEPRAKQWLQRALRLPANEKSSRVSLAINGALARLGDEDGIRRLVLYSRGDTAERTEALLILAELDYQEVREDLLYALLGPEEEYLEARLIAARGLGKLGFKEGYDLAARMLSYTDPNRNPTPENPDRTFAVRSLAIHALAEIGDPRALGPLREIAAAPDDPRLQVAASYAICMILSDSNETR
ncbi:MAG: HEAT repeat domain-containing protein [Phycisphaerae bacterium]|nr:HEAT repeat domain-containing protein [Phycisphaerae bacterium]